MTETALEQPADADRNEAKAAAAVVNVVHRELTPPQPSGTRLLVVDDTADNRVLLSRLLHHAGYEVETAENGPAALRLVETQRFDLVLLDVMMPGVSGLEVLDRIRRTHSASELPVIMVTALNGSDDLVNALEHGATDYVTKPFNFRVVLARLRAHVALKQAVDRVRELERGLAQRNGELLAANQRMKSDLEAAGKIQAALLPTTGPDVNDYRFAWRFNPSAELAGDIFNVFRLDERHLGLYVLDVSGHGVAAALLSVTVSRFLFPIPDPTSLLWERDADGECRLSSPARVAQRLCERFPIDSETGQFFTLVYGLLDLEQNVLRYVSAGHPPIVRHRAGAAPALLPAVGFPVGVVPGAEPYEEHVVELAPGDRVYVYSDGVPEAMNPARELFGPQRLLNTIADIDNAGSVEECLDRLSAAVCQWSDADRCQDDQTVLCVERQR
jgi:sigma-B regulation protein RsbU (phosphoserine phosphatase)